MTAKKAKELLADIETFVHIGGFETGCRVNLKRAKSLCHYAYNEYKDFCDDETKLAVMVEMDMCRVLRRKKEDYITFSETTIPVTTLTLMMDINSTMAK